MKPALQPDKIRIRAATIDDVALIGALAGRIWRRHYEGIISGAQIEYMLAQFYSPEALKRTFAQTTRRFLLAFDHEEPIGYASSLQETPGQCLIHMLYVDPDYQGHGVGKMLLGAAIDIQKPVTRAQLTVNRHNVHAINFYFSQGFSIDSVTDKDIGGGFTMNDFLMVKPVS